jgi:hypothetical protein
MLELLGAIPSLIKLLSGIFDFIKGIATDNPKKFIADAGIAFDKLNNAKTSEEKLEAGKQLQDLIRRL